MSDIVNTTKWKIKDIVLGAWLPRVYEKACAAPIEKGKILFVEAKEDRLPDSFKVLYERLDNALGYEVEFVSLHQKRDSYARYCLNCADMLRKAATAKVVFLNDASDVLSCIALRNETKVVQLWHACGAFKKWGMSTADLKFGGSGDQKRRHPFYENLALVTVSSPEVVWAYAEAMDLEDRKDIIKPLGVSRTDVFFDDDFLSTARARVERVVPAVAEKKVLLYAPTFRGRVNSAKGPDALDIARFQRALEGEYVLLIKHHPFVKNRPVVPEESRRFAFDVSDELPIDALLSVADICISDYSSLVFEYSLFERPIVFFAFDKDEYDDWRGFYYDFDELTPGPVFDNNDNMVEYISSIEDRFDKSAVAAFRDRFMSACDGHATERIIEAVLGE
ncbi:CDP-glycerol glycerophosphotransferase family protein [Eggerthella timonensis]|uniref:CDP-glycerol glycerophosphotransferase family protein n=1 Tax=Eggerthella timonensis TaxID=1871008 RepID=UPI0015E120B7|nr:CDP-glycerol glycerophosphotransferase family protein [Eggerthella timonensis]